MIRATTTADKESLLEVAVASGLFEPDQVGELAEMLVAHLDAEQSESIWLTCEESGKSIGVAFAAPERMTDGTWSLYLIAVHPESQQAGHGTALLKELETLLAAQSARLLLVETAGTEDFDYVRRFYAKSGFTKEACIRNFYEAGRRQGRLLQSSGVKRSVLHRPCPDRPLNGLRAGFSKRYLRDGSAQVPPYIRAVFHGT